MKSSRKLITLALCAFCSAYAAVSCTDNQETESGNQDTYGEFTYNGETFQMRSVVLYRMEGNLTQLWISETAGYTSIEQIENSAGELVLTIPGAKIGTGKQTFTQEGEFVKYDDKENSGFCTIECSLDEEGKNISFSFSAQKMKAVSNDIEGHYSGPYVEYTEKSLENQWSYNRKVKDLVRAEFYEMEDGADSRVILYDERYKAVEFTISPDKVGESKYKAFITNGDISSVMFNDGERFRLDGAGGYVELSRSNAVISVSLNITNASGKVLRAEYSGPYKSRYANKSDRCIVDMICQDIQTFQDEGIDKNYEISNPNRDQYCGKFLIRDIVSRDSGNSLTIKFIPGRAVTEDIFVVSEENLIPQITIPREFINKGPVFLKGIDGNRWSFTYYSGAIYPVASSTTTSLSDDSFVEVTEENGSFVIDIELTFNYTKSEDAFELDSKGNRIKIDSNTPETDASGNPREDEDGNIIYKKTDKTKLVDVKRTKTIDLYYSTDTSNNAE